MNKKKEAEVKQVSIQPENIRLQETEPVTSILFTGDLCPICFYEKPFADDKIQPLMQDFIELAGKHDAHVTNLETPLSEGGTPITKCGPNFRVNPQAVRGLKRLSVSHACLANNHIKDYGEDPIQDTIEVLNSADITPLGIVKGDESVDQLHVFSKNGVNIAILNVAEGEFSYPRDDQWGASSLNEGEIILKINQAKTQYDAVVLSVHAGREYTYFPATWLRKMFRRFIDAGASAVVAHHTHSVQGMEFYGDGVICYSLSNFVFDFSGHQLQPSTRFGFALSCGFSSTGLTNLRVIPFQKNADYSLTIMKGQAEELFFSFLNELSAPLYNEASAKAIWDEHIRADAPHYLSSGRVAFARHPALNAESAPEIYALLTGYFNNCQTHREVMRSAIRLHFEDRTASDPKIANMIKGWHEKAAEILAAGE